MLSNRSLVLASALLLPFSIVACGGGDDSSSKSGTDGGGSNTPPPAGTHYQYVVNKVNLPTASGQGTLASDYGLDLGSATSSTPDGTVDNRLGQLLGTIGGLNFPLQSGVDTAINKGEINLLVDFQTTDFATASNAGFTVKYGANPMPAPCANAADMTCGLQLKGGASFTIDPTSPSDAQIPGAVTGGTFNGGPGNVSLAIALGAGTINISLVHARVKAMGISATGMMSVNVGGLVTMDELTNTLAPAIATAVNGELTALGCQATGSSTATPPCGCTGDTTVPKLIYGLFDTDHNCVITGTEITSSATLQPYLTPDSCSTNSCTAADSLSLGVNVSAVPAMFPM
jgi:hypothetical protein